MIWKAVWYLLRVSIGLIFFGVYYAGCTFAFIVFNPNSYKDNDCNLQRDLTAILRGEVFEL